MWMANLTNKSNISMDKIFPDSNLLSKSVLEKNINQSNHRIYSNNNKKKCLFLPFICFQKNQRPLHISVLNLHNQWD